MLAYFETGLTNAYTEGITNKVKVINILPPLLERALARRQILKA